MWSDCKIRFRHIQAYLSIIQECIYTVAVCSVLQNRCSWNLCEIRRKAHMPESIFNKAEDILAWNFKLKTATRIFFIPLMNFGKVSRTSFYRTPPDDCSWYYLVNLTFKLLILSKFIHSINIVGMLNLMSKNLDFRTSILQFSYYKNNF